MKLNFLEKFIDFFETEIILFENNPAKWNQTIAAVLSLPTKHEQLSVFRPNYWFTSPLPQTLKNHSIKIGMWLPGLAWNVSSVYYGFVFPLLCLVFRLSTSDYRSSDRFPIYFVPFVQTYKRDSFKFIHLERFRLVK